MWPVLVVVRHIDTKDALQVAAADDEEMVETVGADGAHPALRKQPLTSHGSRTAHAPGSAIASRSPSSILSDVRLDRPVATVADEFLRAHSCLAACDPGAISAT
jgi:hypothetical protein